MLRSGPHASTTAAAPHRRCDRRPQRTDFGPCHPPHLLARVTSASREELDWARIPPDLANRFCSFPLTLLSSFRYCTHFPTRGAEPHSIRKACLWHVTRTTSLKPSLSTSPSPRLRSAKCRLASVHLSLARVRSPWWSICSSSFRQWRFLPRPLHALPRRPKPSPLPRPSQPMWSHLLECRPPIPSLNQKTRRSQNTLVGCRVPLPTFRHRATPFRLSRRTGAGDFSCRANLAVVTLCHAKAADSGNCRLACASLLNGVEGFRFFNIRQWLGIRCP